MAKILGIDLGTTNSGASVVIGKDADIVVNQEGARLTPSVVAVSPKTNEQHVGQTAKRQAVTNPENTVYSVKRLMGRKFTDEEVEHAAGILPYKIVKAANGDAHVEMNGKVYPPPHIAALVLQKIKQDAEAKLGEDITQAVITVPAYFNDAQRQATKDAGKIAGLEVLRILNEPTAAALAYGLDKKGEELTVAVFDLGGGTFDISILEMEGGVFEVKSTNGDTYLGGDDFDHAILQWLVSEFKMQSGIDLSKDKMALQRLKDAAETAKVELSTRLETEINLPFITADASGPQHFQKGITRAKLEQLVGDLIARVEDPCKQAMEDAKVTASDIDVVILVGGMTRMPAVQERVEDIFGKEPSKEVNPDEAVALGAGIQAGVLSGEVSDIVLLDVTPLTLSLETLGGAATTMIGRNTTIPTKKTEIFTTAADGQTSVDIHVFQGERPMANDNKSIGQFILDGLLPAPRGMPQIEVTFDIDANGILSVHAVDKGTGKEQKIVVRPSSGLTDAEIDRMTRDAEANEAGDREKREAVEVRNESEALVYGAEKTLEDHGDKITGDLKGQVEEKIGALRTALGSDDVGQMRSAKEDLSSTLQHVGEAVYGGSTPSYNGADGDLDTDEDIIDGTTVEGEFREV